MYQLEMRQWPSRPLRVLLTCMYHRYDIVSDGDLDIVGEKMEEYLKEERARRAKLTRVK